MGIFALYQWTLLLAAISHHEYTNTPLCYTLIEHQMSGRKTKVLSIFGLILILERGDLSFILKTNIVSTSVTWSKESEMAAS